MPPKRTEEEKQPPLLGRPGNNVKMGIVGLPNVGKSSMFNLLSNLSVPAENFPFCTIDPNVSRVPVPDKRFNYLCRAFSPKSEVPAVLTVTDIAGLVRGASEGAGLGNAFLSHIAAVDGIYHMVRVFEDDEVTHVEGAVDPVRDLEIIHDELLLKDLQVANTALDAAKKMVDRGSGGKEKKDEYEFLVKLHEHLEAKRDVRAGMWTGTEIELLNRLQLLSAKPMIYLVNMTERDYIRQRNKWLPRIQEWIDARGNGETLIPVSCAFERAVLDQPEEARERFQEERGAKTALPRVILAGYKQLRLVHFFTVGADEVKCWTIREGTAAPQAAGVIHTDFEKGFVKAECMLFRDFKEHGSEAAVRSAGKLRQEGRKYVVQDGDIIHFKFTATGGGGKKK